MNGTRLACRFLAAAMVVTISACASSGPRGNDGAAAAAAVSKPPTEALSPLLATKLPNVKGKTFTSAIVDFPPAARAAPHRHGQAFVYAYVLDGTVASELEGEPVHMYHRGDNWVEKPGAHHVLTENTSRTKPAKLLVIFVSNTGDKLKVDDSS
jgi:quercetin dioxygenase-like cupin family protein